MSAPANYTVSTETKRVVKLSTALEAAKRRIQELENEATEGTSPTETAALVAVLDLQDQNDSLTARCTELEMMLDPILKQKKVLKSRIAALKKERAELNAASRNYEALQKRCAELESQTGPPKALIQSNTDLRKRNKQLHGQCAALELRVEESSKRNTEFESRCMHLAKAHPGDAMWQANSHQRDDRDSSGKRTAKAPGKDHACEPIPFKGGKRKAVDNPSSAEGSAKRRRSMAMGTR
ncbi:hypothetical protein DFH06DRAFT_1465535 [Mycena polygramma]|nr:hypothetical protein DFH06DRAFT_1465535 [Mycena polygramma]